MANSSNVVSAIKSIVLAIAMLMLVFCLTARTVAAQGCGSPTVLLPCLPAARVNPSYPTPECCGIINRLSADCLCSAVQSPLARVEHVDLFTALRLPSKCHRWVPPGTKCGGYTVPGYVAE